MDSRYLPDAPDAWVVYRAGSLVLALPSEFRVVADALAAVPDLDLDGVVDGVAASGVAAAAPFVALQMTGDGVRVALRGPAGVAAGPEVITGPPDGRVARRDVPGALTARLRVPGGEWSFSLPAISTRVTPSLGRNQEVTEIPDFELSTPAPLPPPPLGLLTSETDDVTSAVGAGRVREIPLPPPALSPPPPLESVFGGAAIRATPTLQLPDGSWEPIGDGLVVGRAPIVGARGGRAVRIRGARDVSRSHLRVDVEDGTVMIGDLGSRNGTVVRVVGESPVRLRGGQTMAVPIGTLIDLGGGVEVAVRES